MTPTIKVVPFLNPFVDPRRIEILIDWQKDWSGELLKNITGFELGIADKPDAEVSDITSIATLDANSALIIPEVAEQLFPLFPAVSDLAPNFINEMRRLVSKPDDGVVSTPQDVPAAPTLFVSPHPTADLARWYGTPGMMMAAASQKQAPPTVRDAVDALLGVSSQQKAAQQSTSQVPDELRKPTALLKIVEAAEASRPQEVRALRDAVEAAAVQEQLTYAEAVRREAIYRRRKAETQNTPLISSSSTDEATLAAQRADLRRIARDEPVIGAMFGVLHWFAWPHDLDGKLTKGKFLFARPLPASERFQPGATLIGYDSANRWVSVLRRDETDDSYFAPSVHVRQISPALLIGEEPDDEREDCSPNGVETRLTEILKSKHVLRPFDHTHDVDPLKSAFELNNAAFEPFGGDAQDVEKDKERELTDAAESLRRHHPPFDAIGITWERDAVVIALTDPEKPKYQCGYKGYRIDVREKGGAWESLCTVERAALGPEGEEVFRARLPREGYVFQAVQNHSHASNAMGIFTMPTDFVQWGGGSAVVSAPLDRLGQALPRMSGGEHPLIALREAGKTGTYPRYGRTYEFRARGVGLTGVGPLVNEDTSADAGTDLVEFLRGIPMAAPEAEVEYRDLVPLGPNGEEIPLPPASAENAMPDLPMKVTGPDPRMDVRALLPITHWRVALHAKGLRQEEREKRGGVAFENACARFVARSRDRWRKRSPEEQRNGAHLSAVDPDCAGIELLTKVWFPFSANRHRDRYLITGKTRIGHREIDDATFSELVVMGEKIVEQFDVHHDKFRVPVVRDLLPPRDTNGPARLLTGFHSLVEVSGFWSEDAKKHAATHRRLWTRQLAMRSGPARPIGGRVSRISERLQAGPLQPLVLPWLHTEASYAGLAKPELERALPEPDQKPAASPTAETCEIDKPSHVRAEVIRWRKAEFEKKCGEPPQDCRPAIEAYTKFVKAQLGPCTDDPRPIDKRDPADFTLCLLPQIVPATGTDACRSLVRPIFTFPGAPVHGEIVALPQHGGLHSMPVKLGELPTFAIARIDVNDTGKGYTSAPAVTITDAGGGSGATATAEIKDGKVDRIILTSAGVGYSNDVKVTISGGGGTDATAIARRRVRRLPWIDDEITWVVRLAWCIPLEGGPIERPLELSAVREFHLYRRDKKKKRDCEKTEAEIKKEKQPLAILPRPGVDVLHDIDLDRVEFTWVDAITDRDAHEFEYVVQAIPEDEITFEKQTWVTLSVDVPDSKIATRPESLRFLPMRSDERSRRLGLYVSNPEFRKTTDHVTYFAALAADDPVLPVKPKAKAAGAPDLVPPTFDDLFPASRIAVQPVRNFQELRTRRPSEDGVTADAIGRECAAADEAARAPMFVIANRDAAGRPLISASTVLGNPFFRLHVHAFDDERFPALAHTAASDPAESDWLQFYPDALAWKNDGTLTVANPWGDPAVVDENLVWYRWHFFVPATDTMSFHLSTFYSRAPRFDPLTQQAALRVAWMRFMSSAPPATAEVLVHAEEGLRAPTYSLDSAGVPEEVPETQQEQVFLVLRATADARVVTVTL